MTRRVFIPFTVAAAMLVAACGAGPDVTGSPSTVPMSGGASQVIPTPGDARQASGEGSWEFPACDDVPSVTAPVEAYGVEPIYVANEMPVEAVRSWAVQQPGYQGIWIDRGHNGWITVAFSQEAEQRTADIEREFPGVGVVAVGVDYDVSDLEALRSRIHSELTTTLGDSFASWVSEGKGVVGLGVGVLTAEIRTELTARYSGLPLCVDGRDPATVPAPGPQPQSGDGWVLLVDEPHGGQAYRTGIAYDNESLDRLWKAVGLDSPIPEVDFQAQVVLWFGAVFGSSCPDIRLDDVIVDGSTVHALIVLPDPPVACTADANPHAFVVALERTRLPEGPFMIQLDENGPPPGAPEERTVVATDLSQPGSVASPDQIGLDPNLLEPHLIESGDIIEPGFPQPYRLYIHCGIQWLGKFNDVNWHTDEIMPAAWDPLVTGSETIDLTVTLYVDPEARVEAEANDVTITYSPTSDPIPGCD